MKGVGEGVAGYVTPKVAVGAVVDNDDGEILLVQRADSGIWLYPTGWADVGYSASEVAVKEVREETGIDCEPVRLIAVLDGLRLGFTRVPLYSLVFLCRAVGGELDGAPARDPRRRLVRRDADCPSRWPVPTSGGSTPSGRSRARTSASSTTSPATARGQVAPSDLITPAGRHPPGPGDYDAGCTERRARAKRV